MEQNQNPNEEGQTQAAPDGQSKSDSESAASETPIISEEKEEPAALIAAQPTPNIEPQTETMEVHKHPHHLTHKKKWSEYLLEFSMIFFAVFLGFVAENIRESTVESRREKEYIKSMIEDLKTDTSKIRGYIRMRTNKITMMDSLAALLVSDDNKKAVNDIYYFARYVTIAFPLITSDGTLQQLKNSGGLRLIKKQVIVDSILKYDGNVKYIQYLNSRTEEIENTFREIAGEAFDTRFFRFDYADIAKKSTGSPRLLTSNRSVLNKIAIQVQFDAMASERDVQNAYILNARAIHLIELLRKEYHL